MSTQISDDLKSVLASVMEQAESDMKSAHEVICKLQGLDPKTHDWPVWAPQSHSRQWFDEIRRKFNLPTGGAP